MSQEQVSYPVSIGGELTGDSLLHKYKGGLKWQMALLNTR